MEIKIIKTESEEYRQSLLLRDKILRQPLGLNLFHENLDKEVYDIHIGVFLNRHIIGVLILSPLNADAIKMRQVAVDDAYQGQGIGTQLVAFAEKTAKDSGYRQIVLHARKTAVPFYLKMHYHVVGNEFIEVCIPHYKMVKEIKDYI